jgi:hypothetical protein
MDKAPTSGKPIAALIKLIITLMALKKTNWVEGRYFLFLKKSKQ